MGYDETPRGEGGYQFQKHRGEPVHSGQTHEYNRVDRTNSLMSHVPHRTEPTHTRRHRRTRRHGFKWPLSWGNRPLCKPTRDSQSSLAPTMQTRAARYSADTPARAVQRARAARRGRRLRRTAREQPESILHHLALLIPVPITLHAPAAVVAPSHPERRARAVPVDLGSLEWGRRSTALSGNRWHSEAWASPPRRPSSRPPRGWATREARWRTNGCWAAHRMSTQQPYTALAHAQAVQWGGRTRCWAGTGFGIPDFAGKAAHCEPLPVALEFLENLRRPPFQRQRPRKQALACHRLQQHQACPPRPGQPRRRHRQTWARLPPQRRARSWSPNRCLDGVKGSAGSRRTENHAGAISSKKRISKFDLTPLTVRAPRAKVHVAT